MVESAQPQRPAAKAANKRGAARLAAVQALYQMEVGGSTLMETVAEYESFRLGREIDGEQYRDADAAWFRDVVSGVVRQQTAIDPLIHKALPTDWPLARLDTTLRALMRAGVFEIRSRLDVPVAVIINEYVDVARAFYTEEEPRLVNAVLDRIAKEQRPEAGGNAARRERP
ncbi:transcription antitermination factor NusB [Jiella pacifica]|uniref:Transcription antitermination protein NusB n=1 Tax=Jiella pacifica TaxID=2696469 RepID=A0A6N9SXF7_9HYPH|nr:transcription antitermination factor NusB [Jiella pacifica]NDW02992.1 transcription antitermination factor NusB [Jiella pacifica]